ncbi:MAG: TusE/DsrC/DsvC family sulfur relay protein [Kangiellaceae bacterium]|nr:TusE/DsrC/DsvC family sulfur relay protein [Kangiellaceae bacterium]
MLPDSIKTDPQGYLKDASQWDESIAEIIAKLEGIELTQDHWQVIRYVRQFYNEFNTSPSIRPLVKYLASVLPQEKANSLFLQVLFPEGPAKQATKIAGLPKPARCT